MTLQTSSQPLKSNRYIRIGPLLSGQYDGKQYTLPFRSNCLGMFVNDAHLEAAGVDKDP